MPYKFPFRNLGHLPLFNKITSKLGTPADLPQHPKPPEDPGPSDDPDADAPYPDSVPITAREIQRKYSLIFVLDTS